MKVGICIDLDCGLEESKYKDLFRYIIEWDYPVLPRIDEKISHPMIVLSDEMKEDFKRLTVFEFYGGKRNFEWIREDETMFEYFDNYGDDSFIVRQIDWFEDENNKPYPELYLSF